MSTATAAPASPRPPATPTKLPDDPLTRKEIEIQYGIPVSQTERFVWRKGRAIRDKQFTDRLGRVWRQKSAAAAAHGLGLPFLQSLLERDHDCLDGRKIKTKERLAWQRKEGSEGLYCLREFVLDDDLRKVVEDRARDGKDPEWLTDDEAPTKKNEDGTLKYPGFTKFLIRVWNGRKKFRVLGEDGEPATDSKGRPILRPVPCYYLGGRHNKSRPGWRLINGQRRPVIENLAADWDLIAKARVDARQDPTGKYSARPDALKEFAFKPAEINKLIAAGVLEHRPVKRLRKRSRRGDLLVTVSELKRADLVNARRKKLELPPLPTDEPGRPEGPPPPERPKRKRGERGPGKKTPAKHKKVVDLALTRRFSSLRQLQDAQPFLMSRGRISEVLKEAGITFRGRRR